MKYSRSITRLLIENCPRFPIQLLIVICYLLILPCSLLFVSCLMQPPSEQGGTPPIAQTPVPTDASTNKQTHTYPSADNTELAGTRSDAREQIIEHTGHIVSYNSVWNEPNWVAWELTREETRAPYRKRNSDFEPDPLVEGKKITTHDYTKSGYTRGHMAPSGDMKWDEDAMNECYYTSNICPQNKELNAGLWEEVESLSRTWARRYGKVWICCGPIVDDVHLMVKSKIAVPSSFFKVICAEQNNRYHAIGFIFPNEDCKGRIWQYAYSVDEVERITGHDFFYNLPDDIEDKIEADDTFNFWRRRND